MERRRWPAWTSGSAQLVNRIGSSHSSSRQPLVPMGQEAFSQERLLQPGRGRRGQKIGRGHLVSDERQMGAGATPGPGSEDQDRQNHCQAWQGRPGEDGQGPQNPTHGSRAVAQNRSNRLRRTLQAKQTFPTTSAATTTKVTGRETPPTQ